MDAAAYRQFLTEQKRGEMELFARLNLTGEGRLGFATIHNETYQSERYAETPENLTEMMSMALPIFGTFDPTERQQCAEAVTAALGDTRFDLLTVAYIGRR